MTIDSTDLLVANSNQAITDLIQSVALEETALSHILNAEGEKIQKMVALPDVTPDVLVVELAVITGIPMVGYTPFAIY